MKRGQQKLSVAILYYIGKNEDDEDTIAGVKGIEESLQRTGHPVTKVSVTKKNWKAAIKTPGDIVFNFVEDDSWDLYEKIAYGLEKTHRGQVGHDMEALAYAIQKTPIKQLMKKFHISTPPFILFNNPKQIRTGSLRFPLIIKPANQHAGIGISQLSVVTTKDELVKQVTNIITRYHGDVIAEEYIAGREIHVTVLGNGRSISVLPFCEITFKGQFKKHWNVYTYDAKWAKNTWEYDDARVDAPARIPASLQKKITALVTRAYRALKCRDIARFDIRVDQQGKPFIVDVNMNPSINKYDEQDATLASVYATGQTYDQFIEQLLEITYKRLRK